MDWQTAEDSKAPEGWTNLGINGHAGDSKNCGEGWNGYGRLKEQGQLFATMKGEGHATVKYSDCLGEGFAALYLNGKQIDKSPANSGELRTFRCLNARSFMSRKLGNDLLRNLCRYVVLISRTTTS